MRIGGEEVPARSRTYRDVLGPAHGTVIARVADGAEEDVDHAVEVAAATFASGVWIQRPPAERARVMHRFADRLEERLEDPYRVETRNNGRPIAETRARIGRLSELYRHAAPCCWRNAPRSCPCPGPTTPTPSGSPSGWWESCRPSTTR